jgi:hypothetical protein
LRSRSLCTAGWSTVGPNPSRLSPDQLDILGEIRERCPACEDPSRCAADLATAPGREWEDWDGYCPNAARLRVLAALTMFSDDVPPENVQ